MKTKPATVKDRRIESRAFFIIFKLPALLVTPILGFIIEYIYELPFMLVCLLESRFRRQNTEYRKQKTEDWVQEI